MLFRSGIASDILPKLKLDAVSWSSYDGMNNFHDMYRGVEYLKQQMQPTPYMNGKKMVIIGEVGVPERKTAKTPTERWDYFFGVYLALDVPLIIDWEIYCNEPMDGTQSDASHTRTEQEMRGFWMIKPDGSKSETALYWEKLLNNPGGKFPLN